MRLKYRDLVRFYKILLFSPLFCPDNKLRLGSKIFQIKDRKIKIIMERPGRTRCISMCLTKVLHGNILQIFLGKPNYKNILSAYLLHFYIFSGYFQKGRCVKNYFFNTVNKLSDDWKYSKIKKYFKALFNKILRRSLDKDFKIWSKSNSIQSGYFLSLKSWRVSEIKDNRKT